MLTIFTTTKDFRGRFAQIQENAIESWTKLKPRARIIILGKDYGVAKIAKKYKLKHIADIKTNEQGTPLLSDIFKKVRKTASSDLLCYVNADVILLPDFTQAIKKIGLKRFLICGQRWNLNIKQNINFKKEWDSHLKYQSQNMGKLDQPGALDYFVFPKSIDFKMPSFAVGRGAWDNWLIYKAKLLKIPVIDATETITAIHQNHDYSHAGGYNAVWYGKEREKNLRLVHQKRRPFNLLNADYKLTQYGLSRPDFSVFRLWRNFQVLPVIKPKFATTLWPPVLVIELMIKVYRKIRIISIH